MRTQAKRPVQPAPLSGVVDAGAHVHQLLHLAHALTHTTDTIQNTDTDQNTGAASTGAAGAVVGVDVAGLSDQQCLDWAKDLEALLHFGQALAVQISGELGQRYSAGRYADTRARGQAGLLVQALRLSAAEATRRLKLAAAVLPVVDVITGEAAPTSHPELAGAFLAGEVSQESASTVGRYLADTDRLAGNGRITADEQALVEHTLVDTAREHGPDFIRQLAHRILAHLDPDGQKPSASDLTAKQGLFFGQPRHGLISFHGHLTIEQHEHLMAAIGHATNPNKHHTPDTNNPDTGTTGTGQSTATPPADPNQRTLLDDLTDLHTTTTGTAGTTGTTTDAAGDDPGPGGSSTPDAGGPGGSKDPGPAPDGSPAGQYPSGTADSHATNDGDASSNNGTGNDGASPDPGPDLGTGTGTGTGPDPGHGFGGGDWGGHLPGNGPGTDPPWTRKTIDGIPIPEPGSTETLPGLDPIDPNSTDRAVKDTRTHGQKLLDGLINCLKLAARTNTLPINGGLKPQLILSCTQQDLHHAYQTHPNTSNDTGIRNGNHTGTGTRNGTGMGAGAGTIHTTYNGPMPIHLFDTTLCDLEITAFTYSQGQTIIDAGRTQRLFTPTQRKLLFARDLGCTFPDCTAPAPWCEAHHITPWQAGGPTNLNNAALLCSHHHTLIHTTTWTATINNGTPHYTPPWNLDPTQTPRKNNYHHAHTPTH